MTRELIDTCPFANHRSHIWTFLRIHTQESLPTSSTFSVDCNNHKRNHHKNNRSPRQRTTPDDTMVSTLFPTPSSLPLPPSLSEPLAHSLTCVSQAQTPQQRKANLAYARAQEQKMGKPPSAVKKVEKPQKAPISKIWICKSQLVPDNNTGQEG